MTMKLLLAIICVIFYSAASNEIRAKRDLSPDVRNKLIEVLNKDRQEIGKKLNIKMEIMEYDLSLEQSIFWRGDNCYKTDSYYGGITLGGDSLAREVTEHRKNFDFFVPSYKTIGCSKDFECSATWENPVDKWVGKTAVFRGICKFGQKMMISKEDLDKISNAELPLPLKYGDLIGVTGASGKGSGSFNEEETVEYFGACIFGERVNIEEFEEKLIKAGLPPVSKYADLLGVESKGEEKKGSGAGILKFDKNNHRKLVNGLAMNLFLAIICVIFHAATSNEIRAKRDLSPDVRDKLIEVLNKDRQEIGKKLNIKMEIMKYDLAIERSIVWSEDDCLKSPSWKKGIVLSVESLVQVEHNKGFPFFIPSRKTIGCSKDFKCSVENTAETLVHRGICIFGEDPNDDYHKLPDEDRYNLIVAELPTPSKYGDIIGVNGPSSTEESVTVQGSGSGEAPSGTSEPSGKGSRAGNVFSLIMSLFLMIYV
ncbi:hypothetical protein CAEBREN_23470 [Caenorhabditis brenneri]|uniref:Uncharacterized protein n=1 Tax=Caenorhabditis brenneri TaxID=135651 RepID=G0N7E6_CAEBE|nr:hypothetical protein CAEBREN_23470 [Caenorhabditis brenneri]